MIPLSNDLHKSIYGDNFDPRTNITVQDMIKTKGQSRNFISRIYHQIKTRLAKGSFVTDKMVKKFLHENDGERLPVIAKAFKTVLSDRTIKQTSRERKMEADLAKIFSDRIDVNKVSYGEKRTQTNDCRVEIKEAYIVLRALRILEQYDPEVLLRTVAYENNSKGEEILSGKASTGIAKDFVDYLITEYPNKVADKKGLEEAYKDFIEDVTFLSKFDPDRIAQLKKLDTYAKDKSTQGYHLALAENASGLYPDADVVNCQKMPLNKLLALFHSGEDSTEKSLESSEIQI